MRHLPFVRPALRVLVRPALRVLVRPALRVLLGLLFVGAGAMHFVAPTAYIAIMPPYLPAPRALVLISGACEIAGGVGLWCPPSLRRAAGWGLIALLIAVFPANIEIALHGAQIGRVWVSSFWGWVRLPAQAVLIAWVWWVAIAGKRDSG